MPHPLVTVAERRQRLRRWPAQANPRPQRCRPLVARRLDGQARELSLCFAPLRVNSYKRYQPSSWAPTAQSRGDWTTARSASGSWVTATRACRVECVRAPTPAYALRVRSDDRQRPPRHRAPPRAGRSYVGNGYTPPRTSHVPHTRRHLIDLFEASELKARREGVRRRVHCPSRSNTAKREWSWFSQHVTDWGLRGLPNGCRQATDAPSHRRHGAPCVARPGQAGLARSSSRSATSAAPNPRRAGGQRQLLERHMTDAEADEVVQQKFDGLVLIGGADVDPHALLPRAHQATALSAGRRRHAFDIALAPGCRAQQRAFDARHLPTACRC